MSISRYINHIQKRVFNYGKFNKDVVQKLSSDYRSAAKLVFTPVLDADEKALANKIDTFRATISGMIEETEVYNYSSPKSNTFSKTEEDRAVPGPYEKKEANSILRSGTAPLKGILLRRIIQGTGVKRVLELGTQVGFSGCYFLSVDGVELVTIEGSPAQAKIARKNLERISSNFTVQNVLFDEAIDQLIADNQKFDCVFIDGQHEKEATIYYAERVRPLLSDKAILIYDDIYFSEGMKEAWDEVKAFPAVTESIDLLRVGVCTETKGHTGPPATEFDLGSYIPRLKYFVEGY